MLDIELSALENNTKRAKSSLTQSSKPGIILNFFVVVKHFIPGNDLK
jgi:hypothetical protein